MRVPYFLVTENEILLSSSHHNRTLPFLFPCVQHVGNFVQRLISLGEPTWHTVELRGEAYKIRLGDRRRQMNDRLIAIYLSRKKKGKERRKRSVDYSPDD